jgi:hypothetical protein
MSKQRVTFWLEEETVEMLDGAVEEAARDPEIVDEVSRGMLGRHLINLGVDEWNGKLRDLLPDALLEKYRIKWRKKRRKDEDYKNKLAAYWRQNVNRELTKFYDDEAAARPQKVRLSMEKWREEARDVYDDEEALREDLAWLDRKLDEYEEAVEYTDLVPDRGFERVSPEVETGADLRQLTPCGTSRRSRTATRSTPTRSGSVSPRTTASRPTRSTSSSTSSCGTTSTCAGLSRVTTTRRRSAT